MSEQKLQSQTVQTTGHAWDGDLQEYNNPLPVWW
ncbi:MAG TPA: cbb3-type cytochrome c oxidase N-terminal domain-containing protein, partial [Thiobacillus sp.]|nr:cbb3-type cytochrome c oxidase N-terminal domain-containing protein [Thiobacillus sp.]